MTTTRKHFQPNNPITPTKYQDFNSINIKNPPTLRQGDWICLNCTNLNFSFRMICNRCKSQTRQNNFYNYIIPLTNMNYFMTQPKKTTQQHLMKQSKEWSTQHKTNKSSNTKENKIFQNALLLTPTKDHQKVAVNNDCEQPYKSPMKIPSVSPLLKRYNDTQVYEKYCSPNENQFNNSSIKIRDFNEMIEEQVQKDYNFDEQIQKILFNIQI